ncbi:hypothetical protein F2Q69_00030218 [Brassica cretica]|uniref:Uncharacterized protein n=1 Tax=Brassica cretica TaxID=69181 RepID=A0A8S9RV91_BRACR|nr:hypothetical protein F2Q69_00030218 [Brassica cretica]
MEGSPYRKSSISWKGGRSLGLVPRFLLAGTWSVPLSGTRGPGSCPEAGRNDTEVFFPNSFPLIARFRHRTRGITCAHKSTGVAHSQQAPLRQDSVPSVSLSRVPLKPKLILNPGKDWFLLIWPEPNSSILNFLEMMWLEIVLVGENRSLLYALESLGPETGNNLNFKPRGPRSVKACDFFGKIPNGFSFVSRIFFHSCFSFLHASRSSIPLIQGAGMGENPSARLTLISTSGEAGYYRSLAALRGRDQSSGFCGPFCRFPPGRWTSCQFVEDCRSVSLARRPSLHCWVLLLLGSGNRDRDLSHAPASIDSLAIADSRPVFPGDEGSQHGHEMGSHIHPAERPDPSGMISEEVSSRCLCPASLVARPSVGSWRDPCGVEDEDLARSLSSELVPLWRTLSETMRSGRYRSLGGPSRDSGSASSETIAIRQTS